MQKHLLISFSLLLVCQFALTQQNLRLTDASSAQVYWQATDAENTKIKAKKVQKTVFESKDNPTKSVKTYKKCLEIAYSNQIFHIKGKLNTKDKAYESRFLFGGQRAVLLQALTRLRALLRLESATLSHVQVA
jgi:hypothetical protein